MPPSHTGRASRRIPQDRQLRRLAEILELDLDELLDLAEAERCRQDLNRLERKYKGKFKSVLTERIIKRVKDS